MGRVVPLTPLPSAVLVTCRATSRRWTWVPPAAHTDTGRPVLGRVQGGPGAPTSALLCRPPTPCLRRPRLRFPWPMASRTAGASAVPVRPTTRAPATCRASATGHRLSVPPGEVEERRGASQVDGAGLCVRARVAHPAGSHPSRPARLAGAGGGLQVKQGPGPPGR